VKGWRQLNEASSQGIRLGDWFTPPEEVVRKAWNRPFSNKDGDRKCVTLLEGAGPTTPVWARSSGRKGEGILHEAHPQMRPHGPCRIDLCGRICTHIRCTVKTSDVEAYYSCAEPADSPLWNALDQWPSE
jgi:hypothetical protein